MTDITTSSRVRGSFSRGALGNAQLQITDFDGTPVDPVSISYVIQDTSDATVASGTPIRIKTGWYTFDWEIPSNQTLGKYIVTWNYLLDGETDERGVTQIIFVTEVQGENMFYNASVLAMRDALEMHIAELQALPIYSQQARPSRDRTTYYWTRGLWNQSSGRTTIYRNQNAVNGGYSVNYLKGCITFNTSLTEFDTVHADYNMRWFTDDDLDRFLGNAVHVLNSYPPVTNLTLSGVVNRSPRHIATVLYGAARDALLRIMLALQTEEPIQIFGGRDAAQKKFDNFKSMKENYEKLWTQLLEQKKFGPWPNTRAIIVPEFTLPGGRCISLSNRGLCKIKSLDNRQELLTFKEIFDIFNTGCPVYILSQPNKTISNNPMFVPVEYAWRTGRKNSYRIESIQGYYIDVSDEHLIFVNDKYVSIRDINVGDYLECCLEGKKEQDKIRKITKLRKQTEMIDLEVPLTYNFFGNGIKCHNSRWFRHLFSQGSVA